ncbi:MAG: hypothetical protein AB2L11_04200 [Syntrophobacteraceae bacterium]
MKLHEVIIKPASGFGTPLMGDTLFGHFCWQAAYDVGLLNGGLDKWIARYEQKPFAVFSSAWPRVSGEKVQYAMRRPALPNAILYPEQSGQQKRDLIANRKELSKKRWMLVNQDLNLDLGAGRFISDKELIELGERKWSDEKSSCDFNRETGQFLLDFDQPHNSINRLTMTTGEGGFAPFSETSAHYYPGAELAVFVLVDEEATDIRRVVTALERIGEWGYGKNASTGLGRYKLLGSREMDIPSAPLPNACYTLAPCVPQTSTFSDCFFNPFVRFGKHGDKAALSPNPFKNPVFMASEGAVFLNDGRSVFDKPYIGRAVTGTSKAMPQTVFQGYSPYLPFRLEGVK